jgi:hypothetical protein
VGEKKFTRILEIKALQKSVNKLEIRGKEKIWERGAGRKGVPH